MLIPWMLAPIRRAISAFMLVPPVGEALSIEDGDRCLEDGAFDLVQHAICVLVYDLH